MAAEHLRLLAEWFERVHPQLRADAGREPMSDSPEIETDLRRWADALDVLVDAPALLRSFAEWMRRGPTERYPFLETGGARFAAIADALDILLAGEAT